jgi:hypothetical protein
MGQPTRFHPSFAVVAAAAALMLAVIPAAVTRGGEDPFGPPSSPTPATRPASRPTTAPTPTAPATSADPAAAQAFERIYGARMRAAAKTSGRADDVELAKQLLADVSESSADPALRAVMLNKAYDLAMTDCAGLATAIDAVRALVRLNVAPKSDTDDMLLWAYEEQSHCRGADLKKLATLYLDKLAEMADDRLKRDDVDAAIACYQRGIPAAKFVDDKRLDQQKATIKALRTREPFLKQAIGMRRSLEKSPDPKRAADLVRLLLVELDDPASAASYLPMLADPMLARVVRTVVAGSTMPSEADERATGAWYRAQANAAAIGKVTDLARAKFAFERALSQHAAHDEAWLELRAALADATAAQAKLEQDLEAARQREAKAHEPRARTARSGSPARPAAPSRVPPGGYDN